MQVTIFLGQIGSASIKHFVTRCRPQYILIIHLIYPTTPFNTHQIMSDDIRKRFESYLPKYGVLWKSMVTSDVQISSVQQESSCLASTTTYSPSPTSSSTSSSIADVNLTHLLMSYDNNTDESGEKLISVELSQYETGIVEENGYDETTVVEDDSSDYQVDNECISPIINSVRKKKSNQLIILESSEDEMSSDLNDDDGDDNADEEETTCSEESEYKCCDDDDDDDGYYDDIDDDDGKHNKVISNNHNCDMDDDKEEISDESNNTPKSITYNSSITSTISNSTSKKSSKSKPMSKTAFKKNRERLGQEAFDEFNKKAFNGTLTNVNLSWSKNLRTTSGITRLKRLRRDNSREASIELSIKVIDDISRLRATLLHEMCHAAQW